MRYAVISDIHSNFPALQMVLLNARPYDGVICLGDIVGYGPNPNECVGRVVEVANTLIAGNHDWGAIGRADLTIFNMDARLALQWTQHELEPEYRHVLSDSPTTVRMGDILLAHGSPREPVWEYVVDVHTAAQSFLKEEFQLALIGHTHIPLVFEWIEETQQARIFPPDWNDPVNLEGRRLMINPGSVGQPRDGDPRASYGILDTDAHTFEFHRIAYPIEITQERMRARDLPVRLIDRLAMGR